jgi:hypothetical protein
LRAVFLLAAFLLAALLREPLDVAPLFARLGDFAMGASMNLDRAEKQSETAPLRAELASANQLDKLKIIREVVDKGMLVRLSIRQPILRAQIQIIHARRATVGLLAFAWREKS